MPSVELHRAFIWDCDACGRENIERTSPARLSDDETEEIEEAGIDPEGCVLVPDEVTCKFCEAEFDVEFEEDD